MNIPQDIIEQVRERASLADLCSDLPKFKRTGRGFSACCPFHEDSSPSFSINDDEGLFHCFGCGKKGSIFDYVMETRNLTFPEAVKFLANRVGIVIPERSRSAEEEQKAKRESARRVLLREVLAATIGLYRETLAKDSNAKVAREYLHSRGVRPETIETFKLGYAPMVWDFVTDRVWESLSDKKVSSKDELIGVLKELGITKARQQTQTPEAESGRAPYYDAFRARVIFPVHRSDGVPVALGGRILTKDKDAPKYINSPESPIYSKRRTFYGMYQALEFIRRQHHAFLVEGYLDVISLYQAGVKNAVATCGTAVTEDHAQVLRRMVRRVTAMFDADFAGLKAAASCFPVFLNSGIEVDAVVLPENEDPDSFARAHSLEEIESYIASNRRPVVDVYLDHLLRQHGADTGLSSAVVGGKAAQDFVRIALGVHNPVEQEFLMRQASDRFGVSMDALKALLLEECRASGKLKSDAPRFRPVLRRESAQSVQNTSVVSHIQDDVPPPDDYFEIAAPVSARSAERPSQGFVSNRIGAKRPPLRSYWQQLIVSLLTEPRLASSVLEMPTLIDGIGVADSMPGRVRQFIEKLRDSGISGISLDLQGGKRSSVVREMTKLLEQFGFEPEPIVDEAFRQLQIGGVEARKVVEDAKVSAARSNLRGQVDDIRKQEAGELSEGERTKLIQEKLLARRKMDRISEKINPDK